MFFLGRVLVVVVFVFFIFGIFCMLRCVVGWEGMRGEGGGSGGYVFGIGGVMRKVCSCCFFYCLLGEGN